VGVPRTPLNALGKARAASSLAREYLVRRRSPRLFAIGDSHSVALWGGTGVRVIHLGPITANRAGREGELARLVVVRIFGPRSAQASHILLRVVIRPGDGVVLFFGEIDVRAHFADRIDDYGSAEGLARSLATRLSAEAVRLADITKANVGIASVTPPADISDAELPTRGTIDDRVRWTKLLNQEFGALCERSGIRFVDTYHDYADDSGQLTEAISDGSVHIRKECADVLLSRCRELRSAT
jgi:hypothetical protein